MRNLLLLTLLLVACSTSNQSSIATLELVKSLKTTQMDYNEVFTLENYSVIQLRTHDSSIISGVSVVGVIGDTLVMANKNTIYFFSHSGELIDEFNHQGDGIDQYLSINEVEIDKKRDKLVVNDYSHRKLNFYDYNGEFIASVKNDSIASISFSKDFDYLIASYSPSEKWENLIGIYDSNLKFKNNLFEFNESYKRPKTYTIDRINRFNGDNYIYSNDTLYVIDKTKVEPFLAINKNYDAKDKELFSSMFGESGYLLGDFYFLRFYHNNIEYSDVWRVSDEKLLSRNKMNNTEEYQYSGAYITLHDRTVYLWPNAVIDNYIYFIVAANQTSKINPNYNLATDSPIVIKAHIDDFRYNL